MNKTQKIKNVKLNQFFWDDLTVRFCAKKVLNGGKQRLRIFNGCDCRPVKNQKDVVCALDYMDFI